MLRPSPVNWGRGQLMPYESIASFCGRFGAFNGLTLKQTRQFYSEFCGQPWSLETGRTINARKAARLLDEPVSVVCTIYPTEIYAGRKGEFKKYFPIGRDLYVPFCNRCIKMGYHSSFHELLYLEKCPFHHEDLRHMQCLGRGAYLTRYVKTVTTLLRNENPKWPDISPEVGQIFRSDEFAALTRWKADTRFIILLISWLNERQFYYPNLPPPGTTHQGRRLFAGRLLLKANHKEAYFRWLLPEISNSRLQPASGAAYVTAFLKELERLKIPILRINRLL